MKLVAQFSLLALLFLASHFSFSQQLVVFNEKGEITEMYTSKEEIQGAHPAFWKKMIQNDIINRFQINLDRQVFFIVESTEKNVHYYLNYSFRGSYVPTEMDLKNVTYVRFDKLTSDEDSNLQYYYLQLEFQRGTSPLYEKVDDFLNYQLVMVRNSKILNEDSDSTMKNAKSGKTILNITDLKNTYIQDVSVELATQKSFVDFFYVNKNLEEKIKEKAKGIFTEEDSINYFKTKKELEDKITRYTAHYNTFYGKDNCATCNPGNRTDSILIWQNELALLVAEHDEIATKFTYELAQLQKQRDTLYKELKVSALLDTFLVRNELEKPIVEILHAGVIQRREKGQYTLVYSHSQKQLFKSDLYAISLDQIGDSPVLISGDELHPMIVNIDYAYYKKYSPTYTVVVDQTDSADEKDFQTGGDLLGLQETNFLPSDLQTIGTFSDPAINSSPIKVFGLPKPTNKFYKSGLKDSIAIIDNFSISLKHDFYQTSYRFNGKINASHTTFTVDFIAKDADNEYVLGVFTVENDPDKLVNDAFWIGIIKEFDEALFSQPKNFSFDLKSVPTMVWNKEDKANYVNSIQSQLETIILARTFLTEEMKKLNVTAFSYENATIDVLLDSQKEFNALKTPKVTVKGTNTTGLASVYNVTKGKVGEVQDLSLTEIPDADLIITTLPGIRKNYRFSVSMGLIVSPNVEFSYDIFQNTSIAGGAPAFVKENVEIVQQLRPSFFFAWNLCRTDVFSRLTRYNWYKRFELNLGIDYLDNKILDNLYLGAGWSPHRLVHVVGGVRFGSTTRLNFDQVNLYQDTEASVASNFNTTWSYKPTYFVGINLGLDLIPSAIKLFFK